MKKIVLVVTLLMTISGGTAAWAQAMPAKAAWISDLEKDHSGRHTQKTHPSHKVGGTAVRGAKPVSPAPVK